MTGRPAPPVPWGLALAAALAAAALVTLPGCEGAPIGEGFLHVNVGQVVLLAALGAVAALQLRAQRRAAALLDPGDTMPGMAWWDCDKAGLLRRTGGDMGGTGYTAGQTVDRSLWEFFPPGTEGHGRYREALAAHAPRSFDVEFPGPDGAPVAMRVHTRPLPDGGLRCAGFVTSDLQGDLARARREAREAREALARYTVTVEASARSDMALGAARHALAPAPPIPAVPPMHAAATAPANAAPKGANARRARP